MLSIYQLQQLQHTLTKTEKRYFRMQADWQGGAKSYVALFNWLEAQETPLDPVKLSRDWPPARLEPARKYLSRVLLKSMRLFTADKHPEARLAAGLQEATLLINRGLREVGLDQLQRIRQHALKVDLPHYAMRALELERQETLQQPAMEKTESDLIASQQQIQTLLQQQDSEHQHRKLYELLLLRYRRHGPVRSVAERTQLNDLLMEEYALLNRMPVQTAATQRLHLHFQAVYFSMTTDYTNSLLVLRQLADLYQPSDATELTDSSRTYPAFLDSCLRDLANAGQQEGMPYFLDRLFALAKRPGQPASTRYLALYHQLQSLADADRLSEAMTLAETTLPVLRENLTSLPPTLRAELWLLLARLYRDQGAHKLALGYVNAVINEQKGLLPCYLAERARIVLITVLVLAEPDVDFLLHTLQSVERKIRRDGHDHTVERILLHFVRQRLAGRQSEPLGNQLKRLNLRASEQEVIRVLGLLEWAKRL